MVIICYLKSELMGCSTADALQTFLSSICDIDKSEILQVSSDGPNVNLLFLDKLNEQRKEEELDTLTRYWNLWSTHHSSLKAGTKVSDWELNNFWKAMWSFLHGPPTNQATHENITETLDYPLQFCGHRWCENETRARKAESLFDGYKNFVTYLSSLKNCKQPDPKNKSWQRSITMIHDPVLPGKLKFFKVVSEKSNAFLRCFQTDKLMVPFMATILKDIVHDLLSRIVLKDLLKNCGTL